MLRCKRDRFGTASMSHRLFIAIDLPQDVRRRLASLVADPAPGVRPVPVEQLHLTLHFLGDADDAAVARLAAALPRVGQEPFTIALTGVGVFPPGGRPTVLWAGVDRCESLRELHAGAADALAACGFVSESRPWIPHVTLARLAPRVPLAWTNQFLDRHRRLAERSIPVTALRLYESERTSQGPVHVPVATVRLSRTHGPAPDANLASHPAPPMTSEPPGAKPVQSRPSGP